MGDHVGTLYVPWLILLYTIVPQWTYYFYQPKTVVYHKLGKIMIWKNNNFYICLCSGDANSHSNTNAWWVIVVDTLLLSFILLHKFYLKISSKIVGTLCSTGWHKWKGRCACRFWSDSNARLSENKTYWCSINQAATWFCKSHSCPWTTCRVGCVLLYQILLAQSSVCTKLAVV